MYPDVKLVSIDLPLSSYVYFVTLTLKHRSGKIMDSYESFERPMEVSGEGK